MTDIPVHQSEWMLEFEIPGSGAVEFGLRLSNDSGEVYRFGYESSLSSFYSDRLDAGDATFSEAFPGIHRAARLTPDRRLKLQIFIDAASVEVFADGGATVMTDTFFPGAPFDSVSLYSRGADIRLLDGRAFELKSIWE